MNPMSHPLPPPPGRTVARPRRLVILTVALTLVASLTLVWGGVLVGRATDRSDTAAGQQAGSGLVTTSSGADTTDDPGDLSSVISRAMDSVVAVRTTATRPGIFGSSVQVQGQGSGVIVATGVVVTNDHVVEGATSVTVSFGDQSDRVPATVLSTDAVHDVAVLAVDTGDHPPIRVGASSDLRLGDTVVALGYPLGLGATATSGIVSGLDRNVTVGNGMGSAERLEGLLQTDAAINPGNSGGPLIDESGRLVGINTAAASASSAENIGFAIAIDSVLPQIQDVAAQAA